MFRVLRLFCLLNSFVVLFWWNFISLFYPSFSSSFTQKGTKTRNQHFALGKTLTSLFHINIQMTDCRNRQNCCKLKQNCDNFFRVKLNFKHHQNSKVRKNSFQSPQEVLVKVIQASNIQTFVSMLTHKVSNESWWLDGGKDQKKRSQLFLFLLHVILRSRWC